MTTRSKPSVISLEGWTAPYLAVIAHGAILSNGWSRQTESDGTSYGLKEIDSVTYKAETAFYVDDQGTDSADVGNARFIGIIVTAVSGNPKDDAERAELQQSLLSEVQRLLIPGVRHPDRHPQTCSHIHENEDDEDCHIH